MNEKFGEYKLLRLLGEGQSTRVYLAEHESNGQVALKTTIEALSPEWSNSFLTGVRRAASLSHPNIGQVHDWGTIDGRVFEVSDFILGRDLQKVAERGFDEGRFFPVPLAVSVIASAAGGLHYAHSRRDSDGEHTPVFHEDLCPQNVILGADGNVKLTDFAVGEALRELSPVPGRLAYLSPEQIDLDYGSIDARTDVFSLGVVAYELITCKRLFKGDTDEDTFEKVLTLPIMPPHHVRSEVDTQLSNIIMQALEREPTLRFQNIRDFQMSLVDWLSSQDNHTTDAHLSAYINSLFPEFEQEKVPEETNALVISASLFEQMDASSGVNFEKWAEEQSQGQVSEMEEETPIAKTKELYKSAPEVNPSTGSDEIPAITDIGLPSASSESSNVQESEPQLTQEFLSSLMDTGANPQPEQKPKKNRIALADLPMPTLSLSQSSSIVSNESPTVVAPDPVNDFEVPPTTITQSKLESLDDSEAKTTLFDPEPTIIENAISVDLGEIEAPPTAPMAAPNVVNIHAPPIDEPIVQTPPQAVQPEPVAPAEVTPAVIVPATQAPPSSISAEIQTVGPGSFRPPAFTPHGSPWKENKVELVEKAPPISAPVHDDVDIEDWNPKSNGKGILVGLLALAILAIFAGGIYMATNAESTLEKDVGGKKIDPTKIKELAVTPPPANLPLTVNSEIKDIHYIVNGKLKKVSNGTIPIFKGVTNEVIAMAPGHVPKMEMVSGEPGVAPLSFELSPIELELDSELQIMTDPRGASIIVDGIPVGTSPTTVKLSSRVEHHVEISASGRRSHGAFIGLLPGKNNLIDAQLEADKRSYVGVNFGALPRGSVIKLDGKALGMSPVYKKLKRNRIMRVDISQQDSLPTTRRLSLVDHGSFEMRPFLRKISRKKGTISLNVIPKGAEIYIGANGYGLGPIKRLKLAEGTKRVVIDSAAGRVEKNIEVVPDKHIAYTLKLKGKKAKLTKKVLKK